MNERTNQPKTFEDWFRENISYRACDVDSTLWRITQGCWGDATAAAQAEIAGLRQDCWKLGFDEGVEAGKSADRQTEQQRDALMRDLQTTIVTHAAALRAKDEEIKILAAREAKLIADTLRAAAALASKMGDAASKVLQQGHDDDAASQLDTSDEIRDAILALTPAQIAAQAEERDRRVRLEAMERSAVIAESTPARIGHAYGYADDAAKAIRAEAAAHRAAVQEGKDGGCIEGR